MAIGDVAHIVNIQTPIFVSQTSQAATVASDLNRCLGCLTCLLVRTNRCVGVSSPLAVDVPVPIAQRKHTTCLNLASWNPAPLQEEMRRKSGIWCP